jgi:hypothetical protein
MNGRPRLFAESVNLRTKPWQPTTTTPTTRTRSGPARTPGARRNRPERTPMRAANADRASRGRRRADRRGIPSERPRTRYPRIPRRPTDITRDAMRRSDRLDATALDHRAVAVSEPRSDHWVGGREEGVEQSHRQQEADRTTRVESATTRSRAGETRPNPAGAFGSKNRDEPSRCRRSELDRSENRRRPQTQATGSPRAGPTEGRKRPTEDRRWTVENWR